jgi:hypothetical protein
MMSAPAGRGRWHFSCTGNPLSLSISPTNLGWWRGRQAELRGTTFRTLTVVDV